MTGKRAPGTRKALGTEIRATAGQPCHRVGQLAFGGQPLEELLQIRQRLAAANPAAYEPDLAMSLVNLGWDLSGLGQYGEALAADEQALQIRRRLAAANLAAYEPDLAESLSNLGVDLSGLGRYQEALAAAGQAVEVYRRLAAANAAAYEPSLARSLCTCAAAQSTLRTDLHTAMESVKESAWIYGQWFNRRPALAYNFRSTLITATDVLRSLGHRDAATIIRRLTTDGALEEAASTLRDWTES